MFTIALHLGGCSVELGILALMSLERPDSPEKAAKSIEAELRPDLVARYSLFRDTLNPKSDVVYHPCGANDVSPSAVFPSSRVIYADIDNESMDALRKKGYEAHTASALEFNPGNVNILFLLNPAIDPSVPATYVTPDGYIVTNDYHGTASTLAQDSQYALRALVRESDKGELYFDTENLEDYVKEIDSEEEFQNAPFDFGAVHYLTASNVVEAITGKKENILAEYKRILQMAREQTGEVDDEDDPLIFQHNGRTFVLEAKLPKKKGTVDDTFVFQKLSLKE